MKERKLTSGGIWLPESIVGARILLPNELNNRKDSHNDPHL